MKLAVCWIGIGDYARYFDAFYSSFNKNFCVEQERTFFIFTDSYDLMQKLECNDSYSNCMSYDISHACHHMGFILFRKFKYLLMAEDKFTGYDYVIFCNGNMVAERPIPLSEITPGNKDISVVPHACDTDELVSVNGNNYSGTAAECHFKDWQYLQAGFFVARAPFFLKMANCIESMRMKDKSNGVSNLIPFHDESYYNSFMFNNANNMRTLPYLLYNCPFGCETWDSVCRRHTRPALAEIAIMTYPKEKYGIRKGKYRDFKNDLY